MGTVAKRTESFRLEKEDIGGISYFGWDHLDLGFVEPRIKDRGIDISRV